MEISLATIITWLILGALAGSLVGAILHRKKDGGRYWKNLGIGLVGAVIGGGIFKIFNINLGIAKISVSAEDLVAAIGGSFLFTFILWLARRKKKAA